MKVLYFHQYFSTAAGATSTRSHAIAQKLVTLGHQVTVVCAATWRGKTGLTGDFRRGRREGVVDGIHVIELKLTYSNHDSFLKRTRSFLAFAWRSTLIAVRSDCDLLYATSTPLTAGIPGIFFKLTHWHKPFIFEVRDLWPELPKAMGVITNPVILGLMGLLERTIYFCSTAGVGLSPGIVDGMRSKSRKGKPIEMIPNGADMDLFGVGTRDVAAARANRPDALAEPKYDVLFSPGVKFVFTGTHGVANGLHAVLDAAAELKRREASGHAFVFVGDGKQKPELVLRAEEEGLDQCTFLEFVPKTQLHEILDRVDVGMMILANVPAYFYGTSPNKFFDYIAAGMPVLNNYPGWLAGLIEEHDCGMAVPAADPKAFADAVEQLAGPDGRLQEMATNARRLAEQAFDREIMTERAALFILSTAGHET